MKSITLAILWFFVRLMQLGSDVGTLGGVFAFFAAFPIVPVLLLFFAAALLPVAHASRVGGTSENPLDSDGSRPWIPI